MELYAQYIFLFLLLLLSMSVFELCSLRAEKQNVFYEYKKKNVGIKLKLF